MSAFSFRMPLRFLRGNAGAVALTVIALACGVAQVCATDLVSQGVQRAFAETIGTMAGRAALQVSAGEGVPFPEAVTATVAGVPGVELAVPTVSATSFTTDDRGELLTVQGVNFASDADLGVYDLRDQEAHALDDPHLLLSDSVVLTRAFAAREGLKKRDQIALETPAGRKTFTVRGLLEPQGIARVYGGNLIVMDLYGAEQAFAEPGFINRVDVLVEPGEDLARVRDAIAAALPVGLHVEAPSQRQADLHKVIRAFQVMLQGVSLVGLVAAFLIGFNRLATVFESRAWQIGVLSAVGVRRAVIWRELMKESLLLGVVGVVVGIPLGISAARLVQPFIATSASLAYDLVIPNAEPTLTVWSLALAAGLGLLAAGFAAALPAWRAAGLAAAETIRRRGLEQQPMSGNRRWVPGLLVAAAIAGGIVAQARTRAAVWGLIASGLIAVETAIAASLLVDIGRSTLAGMARWLAGPSGAIAMANITHSARRTALTIATCGVGLGAVLCLWMVANSFEESVTDAVVGAGALHADLVVSSAHIAHGFYEAPVSEALLAEIRSLGEIRTVIGQRTAEWHYKGGPIALDTFDPKYFIDPEFQPWRVLARGQPDLWQTVARGSGVVVSSSFAMNLGVHMGEALTLETPRGPLTLQIVGVVTNLLSPRGTVELSRDVFKQFWGDQQITRAFVQIAPNADLTSVRTAIARTLGRKYGLRILSAAETVDYFATQVSRGFAGVHMLAAVVLCVVFVGVADTLAAGVLERTRQLGCMRALGIRRRYIRRVVVVEAVVLGALGLGLGAVSGGVLGTLWVEQTFPFLMGWVIALHVPYVQAGAVAAVTVAICFVAALIPAQRAARIEPAVALRYE